MCSCLQFTSKINLFLVFEPFLNRIHFQYRYIKGALDKCNIYIFVFNSIAVFKYKPVSKFSADSTNAFSFYEVFCEQHHLQSVP